MGCCPSRKHRRALGRVKRVLADKSPPFAFLAPEGGGPDLYFNEHLLGQDLTWTEFLQVVDQYDDRRAPALFIESKSAQGAARAEHVVPLSRDQFKELDQDGNSHISRLEALQFFEAHPDLGMYTARDLLYKRQQEAEDELWKQFKDVKDRGDQLWREGEHLQAKELHKQAHELRQQISDLDLRNNEEMFEFVQTHDHEGETRDGTWIDLHGLTAAFAEQKTVQLLLDAKKRRIKNVLIITGAGIHSGKTGAAIKKRILPLLEHPPDSLEPLSFDEVNAGAYRVTFISRCTCVIA